MHKLNRLFQTRAQTGVDLMQQNRISEETSGHHFYTPTNVQVASAKRWTRWASDKMQFFLSVVNLTTLLVFGRYCIWWTGDWSVMNWRRFGLKRLRLTEFLYWYLSPGLTEGDEKIEASHSPVEFQKDLPNTRQVTPPRDVVRHLQYLPFNHG